MSTPPLLSHRLEGEPYHYRKMQAIGPVVSKIAHDINNYLTAISGFSELVMMELQKLGRPTGATEQIMAAAEQIAALTRKFQVYSRRLALKLSSIDLNQMVSQNECFFRGIVPDYIDLQMDLSPGLWPIAADPEVIQEVLQLLIRNACEAMPNGGQLLMRTANMEEQENTEGTALQEFSAAYVLLSIKDNGPGMSDEAQEHQFEPFFTTKAGHQGFGLFTVFGFIRKMKGSIRICSEKEKGTTVQILFPRDYSESSVRIE